MGGRVLLAPSSWGCPPLRCSDLGEVLLRLSFHSDCWRPSSVPFLPRLPGGSGMLPGSGWSPGNPLLRFTACWSLARAAGLRQRPWAAEDQELHSLSPRVPIPKAATQSQTQQFISVQGAIAGIRRVSPAARRSMAPSTTPSTCPLSCCQNCRAPALKLSRSGFASSLPYVTLGK